MSKFKAEYEAYFNTEFRNGDSILSYYDQVDIADFAYNEDLKLFTYPCPCGDLFEISLADLENGETIARCNSCSLLLYVVLGKKHVLEK